MALSENSPLPLTSNTLTPTERACFRRSATKVGKVLGVRPDILIDVDDSETKCFEPTSAPSHMGHQSPTASAVEIHSEGQHASPTFPFTDMYTDECHQNKSARLPQNRESRLRMKSAPMHRPPVIRVAIPPRLQHVSLLDRTSSDPHFSSDSDDDGDLPYTPAPRTADSINAMRRKKMERLYRILGDDLPYSEVFPESRGDDSGYESGSGHGKSSAVSERLGATAQAPSSSFSSDPSAKFHADQTPLLASKAISPQKLVKPRPISARDLDAILSPDPHKVSDKGSLPRRPHYRPHSSLFTTSDDGMLPGSQMTQIDNSVLQSLRTISESSKEAEGLSKIPVVDEVKEEKPHGRARGSSLMSPRSYSSLRSEWYLSDEEADEKKGLFAVLDGAQEPPKRVWSHKRKPPPPYEP